MDPAGEWAPSMGGGDSGEEFLSGLLWSDLTVGEKHSDTDVCVEIGAML